MLKEKIIYLYYRSNTESGSGGLETSIYSWSLHYVVLKLLWVFQSKGLFSENNLNHMIISTEKIKYCLPLNLHSNYIM